MVSAPGSRTTVGIASPPDQAHLNAARSACGRRARVLISQIPRPVSSSADASSATLNVAKQQRMARKRLEGGLRQRKGTPYQIRSSPERIHHTNQSIAPAELPGEASAGRRDLVIHRMMDHVMVMRVMTMTLVMRRCRKACSCKQEQRGRDSNDLTHDSTLVFDELLPGV
jgi:hypothetical protein